MSRPLFSCVIPVKGDRPFFKDALASLEAQGMGEDLEIIVQDGGEGSGGVGELVRGGIEGELVSGGVESGGVCSTKSQLTTHNSQLHLLYLGRRHHLKGLTYLESALATYYNMLSETPTSNSSAADSNTTYYNKCPIEFRAVSNASGEELEKVWGWCDVLILPTLSDNFGLVIAEALERGKRVITTDGAPAWGDNLSRAPGSSWSSELELESGNLNSPVEHEDDGEILFGYNGRLIYLKGYRDGSDEQRVELLKSAIERICG
jgi:hypothetical protein